MASKIIQQKQTQLNQLQNDLKRTKSICFRVMNKTSSYKASNGKTLKEMEEELAAIKEALGIPKEDNETDIIETFQRKMNKKKKNIQKENAKIQAIRENIDEFQKAIDKVLKKIPPRLEDLSKNGKTVVDTTGDDLSKTLQKSKSDMVGSLVQYKLEIEKLRGFVLNMKLGFESVTKQYLQQVKDEIQKRTQEEIAKLNDKKAEVKSLTEERDRLKEEYNAFADKLSNFVIDQESQSITPNSDEEQKDAEKLYGEIRTAIHNLGQKRMDNYIQLINKVNERCYEVTCKIDSILAKIAKIKAFINSSEFKKAKKDTARQANILMQSFLQSIFMKKKMEEILGKLEPLLKAQADKFQKQIEQEEATSGKVVYTYENKTYTISDLRKWIIIMMKQNARACLETEANDKYMTKRIQCLKNFSQSKSEEINKIVEDKKKPK